MAKWVFDGQKFMPLTGGTPVPDYGATDYAGSLTGNEGDEHALYIRGPHKGQTIYDAENDAYKLWYESYSLAHPTWPVPYYDHNEV